ncbi:MAG: hypothetical protein CSB24_06175 [Deltaproteobacteria bacterium]|nr:MAG: hypothetical protein CSB24_06175 [Deltaproteobacteria bacterium]
MNWFRFWRKTHYWLAIITAIPLLIVICSGLLLQVKKQSDWVQPPSAKGKAKEPTISFDEILEIAKSVPEANVKGWGDIGRLDVRPKKGIIKIRPKNLYEIQIDHQSGEILQVMYRRSDVIEGIHDGSFLSGDIGKLWIFLPMEIGMVVLWFSGIYLFFVPFLKRKRKKQGASQ